MKRVGIEDTLNQISPLREVQNFFISIEVDLGPSAQISHSNNKLQIFVALFIVCVVNLKLFGIRKYARYQ